MKSQTQNKEERSKLMAKIKCANTLPERIVRSFLKQEGFYYRKRMPVDAAKESGDVEWVDFASDCSCAVDLRIG